MRRCHGKAPYSTVPQGNGSGQVGKVGSSYGSARLRGAPLDIAEVLYSSGGAGNGWVT